MPINKISQFENKNAHLDIRINVVMYCPDGEIFPLFNSARTERQNRISLVLYFTESAKESGMGHYMYITDFNKFARLNYINKKNGQVNYVDGFYCHNCLLRFKRKNTFDEHIKVCANNETQRVEISKEGTFTEFDCFKKCCPLPLVGFADFESKMVEVEYCSICENVKECTHSTTFVNQHEPFAFSLVIFDRCNVPVLEKTYAGDDCVEVLLKFLFENQKRLKKLFKRNLPATFEKEEMKRFNKSVECGICGKPFQDGDVKVFHHEHYTSKFVCAAHQDCNLNVRLYECNIPIFFHNLAGYDVNFIVKALGEFEKEIKTLKIMPHNTEKIRKMDVNIFSFMDSLDFLQGSLADITKDLVLSKHEFPLMKAVHMYETEEQKELLLQKGVFPYSIVKSHEQLLNMKCLPCKEDFYSDLYQTDISDEDYDRAKRVFEAFHCEDMLDYAFLYVRLDVILLAEAFIKFRNLVFDEEGLDCAQFLSSPHLSFHLMLKITQVKLEQLSDPEMVFFLENNIRGGLSFVNIRQADCKEEPNVHLAYWDCK